MDTGYVCEVEKVFKPGGRFVDMATLILHHHGTVVTTFDVPVFAIDLMLQREELLEIPVGFKFSIELKETSV